MAKIQSSKDARFYSGNNFWGETVFFPWFQIHQGTTKLPTIVSQPKFPNDDMAY